MFKRHQVDYIHEANFELRKVPAQQLNCS